MFAYYQSSGFDLSALNWHRILWEVLVGPLLQGFPSKKQVGRCAYSQAKPSPFPIPRHCLNCKHGKLVQNNDSTIKAWLLELLLDCNCDVWNVGHGTQQIFNIKIKTHLLKGQTSLDTVLYNLFQWLTCTPKYQLEIHCKSMFSDVKVLSMPIYSLFYDYKINHLAFKLFLS